MKIRAFGRVAVLLGGACAFTWSLPAGAQEFTRDRRVLQGAGYQAGDFDIHPGIAAEVGYDSNYLLRSDKSDPSYINAAPRNPPEGTGLLRITPSIRLSTSPAEQRLDFEQGGQTKSAPPKLALDAGASGTYREFFAESLRDQRNMSAQADATLTILPGRPYYGSVMAAYTRMIQPSVLGNPDFSYNNDMITAGADLAMQPGLGTLDWHFGYRFTGIFFEDNVALSYNNVAHQVYTRGRWRFRPRTALLYDGSIEYRTFTDNPAGAYFALHDTAPVRTHLGIEGLVTPRFSVLAMGGYTGTFTTGTINGDATVRQYDSFNARVEARFFPTTKVSEAPSTASLLISQIVLGYIRDAQASYENDFVGFDRGYLRAEYFFAGRMLMTLEGGVGAFEHPDVFFSQSVGGGGAQLVHSAYTDVRADATLFAEYRIVPTVGLNATFNYLENFSTVQLPETPARVNFYDQSWRRFLVFAGVRWFM